MENVQLLKEDGIATLTLASGKVNAINEALALELTRRFTDLKDDREVRSVILTGTGKFFSFGLDIPELFGYSKEDFSRFLRTFTALYTKIFLFPKPVIAAVNGHAIAGGCMLATACDYGLMVSGKAKISLNEITFGSSVFAGSVEMLKFRAGDRNAREILLSGTLYTAEEALRLGLIERISAPEKLAEEARAAARRFAQKDQQAFTSIKKLLRAPVARAMAAAEEDSIREFVEIWYSENTRKMLKDIKIYE